VSQSTAELLGDDYELSDLRTVELKGKGPTQARFLLGRIGEPASNGVLEVR
jgi:hypothetical protein